MFILFVNIGPVFITNKVSYQNTKVKQANTIVYTSISKVEVLIQKIIIVFNQT